MSGFLSPGMTSGLAAGAEGGDLATQMLMRQLQAKAAQAKLQDEDKQRQARAMIGQVMQQVGLQQGTGTMPAANPNPAQGAFPGGAPQVPGVGGNPATAPQAQGAFPQGVKGAALAPIEKSPTSWNDILDTLRDKTGADPEVIADAVMQVMPEIDKESERSARSDVARMNNEAKIFNTIETLKWRYANTASQEDRAKIMGDIKKYEAQVRSDTAIGVAKIGAQSREDVASTNVAGRKDVAAATNDTKKAIAELNVGSKERIAKDQNELKKELGDAALDLKADQISKTFMYQQKMLELREKGLDYQHADTLARIEAQKAIASMRDEATKRGQDLVHEDRLAAEQGRQSRFDTKTAAVQQKTAIGLDDAMAKSDDLVKDAEGLLLDPNLDKSVGARVTHMPGFMSQDVTNFRSKLDSFKAEKMMALVQQLRSSGNGSTGFGRITNFEAQSLQNSIASLRDDQDPAQFRTALHKLIDQVSASKGRLASAYQQEYDRPKATGTGGKGVATAQPGATAIDTPKEVANEPDGTVFEMDGKQYKKQGQSSVQVK